MTLTALSSTLMHHGVRNEVNVTQLNRALIRMSTVTSVSFCDRL